MFGLESEKLSCMHEIEAYKLFMLNEFQKAKAVFRHGLIGSIWLSLLVVTFHWNMFLVNINLY